MRSRLVWVLGALIVCAGGLQAARAQVQFDAEGKPGTVVAFGDLDLNRGNDRRVLKARIAIAVDLLCGRYGERTIAIIAEIQRCRKRTLESADAVMSNLVAAGIRSNLGADSARLAFSPCHIGRGRIAWCEVRSELSSATVTSRPSQTAITTLAPGITTLGEVGHVYRPPNLPNGPRPLILLLHGAGGDARQFLEILRPIADDRDYIIASAKSAGTTWDIPAEMARASNGGGVKDVPDFGPDVPRIDALLREIFARAAIDPDQVILVGFSDGASYALSLALANPDVFPSVIAFSPGFVKLPERFEAGQRMFIAHGRSDQVIPLESGQAIAEALNAKRLSVRFRPFDGGHAVSRPILLEGLDLAIPKIGRESGATPSGDEPEPVRRRAGR